ncbi:MAG: hypothetical protein HFJ57_07530 [Clostridia bacterium]|nr:hypothetical protein [Clostridia bacterium]
MIELQEDKITNLVIDEQDNLLHEDIMLDEDETPSNVIVSEISLNNNDIPEPNCLALTVKKDYNLTIVKNVFTTTGRLSWKVILATIAINFLNMIF